MLTSPQALLLNQIVVRFGRTTLRTAPVIRNVFVSRSGCDAAVRVTEGFVINVRAVAAEVFTHQIAFWVVEIYVDAKLGARCTVGRIAKPCWIADLFCAIPVQ